MHRPIGRYRRVKHIKPYTRQSLSVAHPLIPLTACQLLLIGQVIGTSTPAFSAALALLVVSRRTLTQLCGL